MVMGDLTQECEVLVIGSGPGGYAAAFRAADLGLDVTMVDTAPRPGGECLFRGCIPSKTLLHLSELIYDARHAKSMGLNFSEPQIDLKAVREWKAAVIDKLSKGLVGLSDKRGVQRIKGRAFFESSNTVRLHDSDLGHIKFRHAIIATGSHPVPFPGIPFKKGSRIMDSSGALALADIPKSLLVVGGGYAGLELASVYAGLGSKVTVVELGERLLPGTDPDLVEALARNLKERFEAIYLNTKVISMEENEKNVAVNLEGKGLDSKQVFDRVLVAIGRAPNTHDIGLENTNIKLDKQGFIIVDEQRRTNDEKIFAVGDAAGGMLLAHKAIREGKVAAEVIAGEPSAFDVRAIPAVVYTDPQIAWCGLTEEEARKEGRNVKIERFPWKFSGRAITMDAPDGLTKIIIEPETERILGVGITGRNVEGLIAEGVLAVEMGALAQDVALSIHAHPTLSETIEEADEMFLGSAIHIMPKMKK